MYDHVMGKSMPSKKKNSFLIHTYLVPPCRDNTYHAGGLAGPKMPGKFVFEFDFFDIHFYFFIPNLFSILHSH